MDKVTTSSIGPGIVEVEEEQVLFETERTVIVFKAQMHTEGIRGRIIRYKKDDSGRRNPVVPPDFRRVQPGEGTEIELKTEAISNLFQRLQSLNKLLEERGIYNGRWRFSISDGSDLVITDRNKASIIRKLLNANLGEELWDTLVQEQPDIASRLAKMKLHTDRITALDIFRQMLDNPALTEEDWQHFFETNKWIFGYGLRYQILDTVQNQPNYGGANITGLGGQRGDFLLSTRANAKFTCLVEIKKPNSPLLRGEYRNGAWDIHKELAGAIAQIQANCAQWEISGSKSDENRDYLENIYTASPKGIVVIGHTSELDTRMKKYSFERFRQELRNPEIITYDELYERARFIIDDLPTSDFDSFATDAETEEVVLPF